MCSFLFVFFFKQKTAYEMRISDWSSDVCSSDLGADQCHLHPRHRGNESGPQRHFRLAKADIAADEAIHGPSRRQILDHIVDDAVLIVGFLIGEAVDKGRIAARIRLRSEEHTSELQSLMRITYAVFCSTKKRR